MEEGATLQVPWSEIDTLLLDMDGTLLDLAFDNEFWLDLVPSTYARQKGLSGTAARKHVHARYAEVIGTLPWYCIDHWTDQLGIDIRELKRAHSGKIGFLPSAPAFLTAARQRVGRVILVTNAHRATFEIKAAVTGVDRWMDAVVCSHDYGAPKEAQTFWQTLQREQRIDPARSLLLDDSLAVLRAARQFGIGHVMAISRPDSREQPREVDGFPAVGGVADLI